MKKKTSRNEGVSITTQKDSKALLQDYLDELIALYHYIDFRGIAQLERFVSLELDQVFVPLEAFPIVTTSSLEPTLQFEFLSEKFLLSADKTKRLAAFCKENTSGLRFVSEEVLDLWREFISNSQSLSKKRPRAYALLLEQLELASAGETQGEAQSFGRVLENSRQLVLLGDPGSGKSTLVKWLARSYALGRKAVIDRLGLDEHLVPIVFSATGFAEETGGKNVEDCAVCAYIENHFEVLKPGLGKVLRSVIESGQAFLLIDGLDEIPDMQRRWDISRTIGASVAACAERAEGTRCLITSRKFGYDLCRIQGMPHWELAPFGPAQIERYVQGWTRALERTLHPEAPRLGAADHEARQLVATINEPYSDHHETLQGFARNPLLLAIIALVRWQHGNLPERRARLYDYALTTLVVSWNRMRTIDGSCKGVELDVAGTLELLEAVALWMHAECPSGTASRREIIGRMAAVIERTNFSREEALATAESYLDSAARWAGVLIERGPNVFGFSHLTFQEYLAARALTRAPSGKIYEALQPRFFDPRWHEIILLVAGYLGEIQGRREECTALVERIRDTEDRLEPVLHRHLLLATEIIGDRATVSQRCYQMTLLRVFQLVDTSMSELLKQALLNAIGSMATIAGDAEVIERAGVTMDNVESWALRAAAVFVAYAAPDKAVALLTKGMNDNDSNVRGLAASLMVQTQGADLPACTAMLNSHWQATGARTLDRNCDRCLAKAVTLPGIEMVLLTLLESDEPDERGHAAEVLGGQLPLSDVAERALVARLEDNDPGVRVSAASALCRQRPLCDVVERTLVALLEVKEPYVRGRAAWVLNKYRTLNELELLGQVTFLSDKDPKVRVRAATVLGRQRKLSEAAERGLVALLEDKNRSARLRAVGVLGKQRNLSEAALHGLEALLACSTGS